MLHIGVMIYACDDVGSGERLSGAQFVVVNEHELQQALVCKLLQGQVVDEQNIADVDARFA